MEGSQAERAREKGASPGGRGGTLAPGFGFLPPPPNSHRDSASPSALRGRGGASPLPARTRRISLPALLPAIAGQRLS